jgi:hypothetical protein
MSTYIGRWLVENEHLQQKQPAAHPKSRFIKLSHLPPPHSYFFLEMDELRMNKSFTSLA